MNTYTCTICGSTISGADHLKCCVVCHNGVCPACTQYQYPNRFQVGVCVRCPRPVEPPFECGRCHCPIAATDFEFFCDMCAAAICANCLWASFENGRLKCAACCSAPMRRDILRVPLRHLIDDAFLESVQVPLQCSSEAVASTSVTHDKETLKLHGAASGGSGITSSTAQQLSLVNPPTSKYDKLYGKEKLGEGAQGVVYRCRTSDNEEVVSKEMIFDDVEALVFQAHQRQAERMRQLNHPHLIRYLDVLTRVNPLRICVIMPYYDEGDLSKYILRQRRPIPEVKLCSIILQVAGALNYLHSQSPPLVHRDIKPENILLLNYENQVLLMDLDLCSTVEISGSLVRRKNGSPTYEYKAPELAHGSGSPKSDVFSLGVVSYVLATLPDFPFVKTDSGEELVLSSPEWTEDSLERAVCRAIKRVPNYSYSDNLIRLLVRMLAHNPAKRPSAAELIVSITSTMEQKLMAGTP